MRRDYKLIIITLAHPENLTCERSENLKEGEGVILTKNEE